MRKSYLSYLFRKIKEKDVLTVPKMVFQILGLYLSRFFNYPFSGPLHGSIITTYKCNLRCSMCNLWRRDEEYREIGKKELSTDEMKQVIDDFAAIGTAGIGFTGGEPLFRRDIYELIHHTKNKGMMTHMSSNGFNISENVIKNLIGSGLDAVGFSLDGATAETHDMIRGVKGSFDRVINAIKTVNKINSQSSKKLLVVAVTVISTLNLKEIKRLVDLLKALGVNKISFIPFHDIGVLSDKTPIMKKHKIDFKEMQLLDETIDYLINLKKQENIIDSSINYLQLFKQCFRDKELPVPCYAGYATLAVDGYGDMFPCFPMMEIGYAQSSVNVRDIPLKKFWRSSQLKKLRKSIKTCRKCYWNNQTEINLLFHLGKVK
jgi:radical SAM protein with 4Fe4S-binding SPASM domain